MKYAGLLLGILSLAGACQAQNACPWVNAATVANADKPMPVDSGAQNTVADGGSVCLFHYREDNADYTMQVTVHNIADQASELTRYESQCASGGMEPLKGIGNEAVMCGVRAPSVRGVLAIGRVRDKVFLVRLTMSGKQIPATNEHAMHDRAQLIAEQVAGNLF